MTSEEMLALASRLNSAEDNGGEQSTSGINHYLFVLRMAPPEDLVTLAAMSESDLNSFVNDEPWAPGVPTERSELWERMMENYTLYEEITCGALAEVMAGFCDPLHQQTSDPEVWQWIFTHMPIAKDEFELLHQLMNHSEWLEVISEGTSYGDLQNDPLYPAMEAAFPGRGLVELYDRIGQTYVLWEADVASRGEDHWKSHI